MRLWHRDFWLLAFANMLITMAVYMQFVVVIAMMTPLGMSTRDMSHALGIYGLGLMALGVHCSYLIQNYRRNRVCVAAVFATMLCMLLPVYIHRIPLLSNAMMMLVARFITGAVYGLAQMVLSSTLVIDACEAHQRTEANYAAAWFGRFGLSLGPLLALLLLAVSNTMVTAWVAAALAMMAAILITMVDFPFRTPDETVGKWSLDRFFMPEAWALFLNMLMVAVVMGMLLAVNFDSVTFFSMLMAGFLLAIVAEKFVFVNAELMSETVAGLILIGFAVIMIWTHEETFALTAPVMVGLGFGLIQSRFLLFFIKLSHHCKRGTSQSTFFLACEMGIAFGMCLGFGPASETLVKFLGTTTGEKALFALAIILVAVALAMYVAFTHRWYLKHKNR